MSNRKNAMSSDGDTFNFPNLVRLLEQTHDQAQSQANRAVNRALVVRNWLFGRYIVEFEQSGEDRAEYGRNLISQLSKSVRFRGSSPTNLRKFREFYLANPIQQTLSVESASSGTGQSLSSRSTGTSEALSRKLAETFKLSWSHYVTLLTVTNVDARSFYEIEADAAGWSVRELERQIASSLYERLALSRDKDEVRKLSQQGQVITKPADLIKDPFVLDFLELKQESGYTERDLESAIIDKLQAFLLELGKGFLFEARQKRFTFDNDHFYVDLVFYNRLLRCFVLLDLKIGKLAHQDLGQMQMYVNYYDRQVRTDDELPTIGIVLCAEKNHAVVELTLPENSNIFTSKYQLYLPSKSELQAELESITAELTEAMP